MVYELRPYQKESIKAIHHEWDDLGNNKTLLVLPTGTGKTIVFSGITEDQVSRGERVLIVAHRDELLTQASDKLYKTTGLKSSIEKADQSCLGSDARVTIGSVQSLGRQKRLQNFPRNYFQTIIVDEAHHVLSPSYQTMLQYFSGAKVLGVTATPDRGDRKNLAQFFDSKAYEYLMTDAVRDGYLCPIQAQMIPLKLDLTNVGTSMGDYREDDLGNALNPYLDQIADEMAESCQGRKTLVFLPLIETSQKFCRILNDKGLRSVEVNGKSPDREEILADFESGRYDILCNSMLLTEGWDCPAVDCIVVLRPTKIRSLYVQMVGRGTRTCPGKNNLLLLDFLWLTTKHNLCRPSSLIGKDEKERDRIDKKVEEKGNTDLFEAMDETEQEEAAEARNAALAQAIAENSRKKRKTVDPLHMPSVAVEMNNYSPEAKWEFLKPTEKQLNALEHFGIDTSNVETRGYASKLINELSERRKRGLATPRQVVVLARHGYDASEYSFEKANTIIEQLSQNGWNAPRRISNGGR